MFQAANNFKIIEFQTVSHCNSDCIVCPWHLLKKTAKLQYLSDDLWQKLLKELAKIQPQRVIPYLNNEPLLDDNIFDRVGTLKSILPNCTMEISTNGSLLNSEKIDALLYGPVDDILISVFGHDETSEKALMNPSFSYNKIVEHVIELHEKNQKLAKHHNIAVVKIDNSPFIKEKDIENNISFWEKHGIKVLRYGFLNRAGNIKIKEERNPIIVPQGCELNRHNERIYMYVDGFITFCCHDWKKAYKMGDFNHQSLAEIWNSAKYKNLRLQIDGKKPSATDFLCRKCKLCPEK